jgi:hypothetical protein
VNFSQADAINVCEVKLMNSETNNEIKNIRNTCTEAVDTRVKKGMQCRRNLVNDEKPDLLAD